MYEGPLASGQSGAALQGQVKCVQSSEQISKPSPTNTNKPQESAAAPWDLSGDEFLARLKNMSRISDKPPLNDLRRHRAGMR